MKTQLNHTPPKKLGFTLVETVLAMGIITIMITAFLAAFGPAVQGVRKSVSTTEATRLSSALEAELSMLKPGQQDSGGTAYVSAFHKAYDWIENSTGGDEDDSIIVYQYRGDPSMAARPDGSLVPYEDNDADDEVIPGQDYVIQTVVRRLRDDAVEDELVPGVVEGQVFYVRMKQLIFNEDGELEVIDPDDPDLPGAIIDPTEDTSGNRTAVTGHADYPEAVIAYQAEFYVLENSLFGYIDNQFSLTDADGDDHPDITGKPVFKRNLALRR